MKWLGVNSLDHPLENKTRFGFGANWQRFLKSIDDRRIISAEKSLLTMLNRETLSGLNFLDIGCGSGLFSLAARRLGATVTSFDYDPMSVACTNELRRRQRPDDPDWRIEVGSVLDENYLTTLGAFDIVYSWGVLHHTGKMWPGLDNVLIPLKSKGQLFIAIYNDQGWISRYWTNVKRLYNSGPIGCGAMIGLHLPWEFLARFAVRLVRDRGGTERGMSLWYDMMDWLGGYPFEYAAPTEILDHYGKQGLIAETTRTCGKRHGCNEFVFRRLQK